MSDRYALKEIYAAVWQRLQTVLWSFEIRTAFEAAIGHLAADTIVMVPKWNLRPKEAVD